MVEVLSVLTLYKVMYSYFFQARMIRYRYGHIVEIGVIFGVEVEVGCLSDPSDDDHVDWVNLLDMQFKFKLVLYQLYSIGKFAVKFECECHQKQLDGTTCYLVF